VTDNRVLNDLDVQSYNALFGAALNTHRAAIGLPPVDNVRDHILTGHPWLAADPDLAPWPEPADPGVVQTGAWILPDERPLPAELEAFLDAGPPPVYVGFGSMRAPADVARVAIEAIRAQGCRVLIARGWADLALVDDRDDCFAVGEVNQQALFGRVAAVVHHGGAGTTTTATRAGAPQVVVPQWADQPYWASRVADLGIGTAHDGPAPTTGSLSAALSTALTPRPAHERPPWPARSAPTGRWRPPRCCSTRSAGKGRQCPREPRGIAGPGKVPGAGLTANPAYSNRPAYPAAARRRTHRRATASASKSFC
jgi:vancomycin aglycone glucosyltransferase